MMVASSGELPAVKYSKKYVASRVADDIMMRSEGRFLRILSLVLIRLSAWLSIEYSLLEKS